MAQSSDVAIFVCDNWSWTIRSNDHLSVSTDSEIIWYLVTCRDVGNYWLVINESQLHVLGLDHKDVDIGIKPQRNKIKCIHNSWEDWYALWQNIHCVIYHVSSFKQEISVYHVRI